MKDLTKGVPKTTDNTRVEFPPIYIKAGQGRTQSEIERNGSVMLWVFVGLILTGMLLVGLLW